jgi:hypothetical protein
MSIKITKSISYAASCNNPLYMIHSLVRNYISYTCISIKIPKAYKQYQGSMTLAHI